MARSAVLALALVLLPAGAAGAAPTFTPMGSAAGQVFADGVRFAAYEATTETTRVVDTAEGTSFDVPTPAGCASGGPYGIEGLAAIGGGHLVWACGPEAMVLDIATRKVVAAAPPPRYYRYAQEEIVGVGSHWISLFGLHPASPRTSVRHAVNWRTGAAVNEPGSKVQAVDLDSPDLLVRMCDPLRRSILHRGRPNQYGPYGYERPYGLRALKGDLVLERCGRTRKVLDRVGSSYFTRELAGGVVTWVSRGRFRVYVPSAGKRSKWKLSSPISRVARTLTRVYQAVPVGPYGSDARWRLESAAWQPPRGAA